MKKYDKLWEEHFALLQEYVQKNKKLPSNRVIYKGFRLGNWLTNQKYFFKNGKLAEYRKELLDHTFPDWKKPNRDKERKAELWRSYCHTPSTGIPIDEFLQEEDFYEALKKGIYDCESWIRDLGKPIKIKKMFAAAKCYAVLYPYVSATYLTLLMDLFDCRTFEEVTDMIEEFPFENASDMEKRIDYMVNTLTVQEKNIIRYRYGLESGSPCTYEVAGKKFLVSNERIRQVIARGLRKMRHPSRKKNLYHAGELDHLDLEQKEISALYRSGYRSVEDVIKTQKQLHDKLHLVDISRDELESLITNTYLLDDISLTDCEFSVRTFNCLWRSGINTLQELKSKSKEELMYIHGLRIRGVQEVEKILAEKEESLYKANTNLSTEMQDKVSICKKYPKAILCVDGEYIPLKKAKDSFQMIH